MCVCVFLFLGRAGEGGGRGWFLNLFDQWWHARWCFRYATVFIKVLRNGWNWVKKLILQSILSFFYVCSLTPYEMPQDFANWKILLTYSSVACCISTGYVVVKFKVFYWFSFHEMTFFWIFFRTISPKYSFIVLKWSEVDLNKTNTVFKTSFKVLNFGSNGTRPNFIALVHFGTQFTPRKSKILLKARICGLFRLKLPLGPPSKGHDKFSLSL